MVTYIRSDLDFILDQIKIAEAHAAGQPLFGPGGLVPAYNVSWGLRTVDGTYNNLLHAGEWGAADNEFPEPLGTQFRTIMVDPDGRDGPWARCLSPTRRVSTMTDLGRPFKAMCSTPRSARFPICSSTRRLAIPPRILTGCSAPVS